MLIIKKIIKYIIVRAINFFLIFPDSIVKIREINFNNTKIYYSAKNSITYRRYKRFEKDGKEKSTVMWIQGFKKKAIFFDIGANVGVFSLYAALKRSAEVYAFEPEPNSFIDLFNSINLNKVRVQAILIPLDKKPSVGSFNLLNDFQAGMSGHSFNKIISNGGQS